MTPDQTPPRKGRDLWRLALFVIIVAAAGFGVRAAGLGRFTDPATLVAAIRDFATVPAAPLLFIAAYAVVATFGLPGTPLTLAGGAIFGAVGGTFYNWIGATIGATGAFFLARSLGKDAVRSFLGSRAGALDSIAGTNGFVGLLRLRLIPVIPFNALNFGAGLAGMRVRDYVTATAVGILPGTAVYTYFADSLLAGAEGARTQALVRVAIAGALLISLSFIPNLARRFGWLSAAALVALSTTSTQFHAQVPGHSALNKPLLSHVVNGMVNHRAFAGPRHLRDARRLDLELAGQGADLSAR